MPNAFSHPYQLDELIFNFRIVGWDCSFLLKFKKKRMLENSGGPDQTPRYVVSDLVWHFFAYVPQMKIGLYGLNNLKLITRG